MTTWRRNVHAANPNLAAFLAEVKGTLLPSSVARRMRELNVSGLRVNERRYGTSTHISRATGRPFKFRIPIYRLGSTILNIKPRGTPLRGPQVDEFRSFVHTNDIRFVYDAPY